MSIFEKIISFLNLKSYVDSTQITKIDNDSWHSEDRIKVYQSKEK